MLDKTTSDRVIRYKTNSKKEAFANELRSRVRAYFRENNISTFATTSVKFKALIGFVLWITVYTLLLTNAFSENLILLLLGFLAIGFINIFLALNVMHDSCHNAFTGNPKTDRILGYTMNFIGGNRYLFTMMHNAHHQFVNIHGIDVTLETHGLFRFTPHEPWKPKHRWQHVYTPIIYSLAMIHWILIKDFKWYFGELHIGNRKNIEHPRSEMWILLISKAFYLSTTLVIPLLVIHSPWWWIVLAWIHLHILPSLVFSLLFQITHVYEGTDYPMPNDKGCIENNYFIHVLETTADFSRKNRLITWITGGLNIHVVHHLFPTMNHGHYIPVAQIVKDTADEYGIHYKENKNFFTALVLHMRILKHLSKPETSQQ